MNIDKLDLEPLQKAIRSLKTSIDAYTLDKQNEFIRDSFIKRFEYSYELSHKIVKRYLSIVSPDPNSINEMTFQELIRQAYTKGILENSWDMWKLYKEARNNSSHSYNEDKAITIANDIEIFYSEAIYLLKKLQDYNKNI